MHFGYLCIVFLTIVAPIPPEIYIPLAGFMVGQGELNFVGVVAAAVLGAVLSVLPWYGAGRYLGEARLLQFAAKHKRWIKLSPRNLQKAMDWFERQGAIAILLSYLVPGTRNFLAIPAGITGISLPVFLLYSILGASIWFSILTATGYLLGSNYHLVTDYVSWLPSLALLAIAAIGFVWVMKRRWNRI